jgi:hypothetical protein
MRFGSATPPSRRLRSSFCPKPFASRRGARRRFQKCGTVCDAVPRQRVHGEDVVDWLGIRTPARAEDPEVAEISASRIDGCPARSIMSRAISEPPRAARSRARMSRQRHDHHGCSPHIEGQAGQVLEVRGRCTDRCDFLNLNAQRGYRAKRSIRRMPRPAAAAAGLPPPRRCSLPHRARFRRRLRRRNQRRQDQTLGFHTNEPSRS